jgi:hypothetical protein
MLKVFRFSLSIFLSKYILYEQNIFIDAMINITILIKRTEYFFQIIIGFKIPKIVHPFCKSKKWPTK